MASNKNGQVNPRPYRKAPGLAAKYLDRTRSARLSSHRINNTIGAKFFFMLLFASMAVSALVLGGEAYSAFASFTYDLPPVTNLSSDLSFKTTQILDRNGRLLYEVDDKDGGRRIPVHIDDVSPLLIDATIATEDKDFYSNSGVDPVGIARAVWQNTVQGQLAQGASTITQQLARNVLIDREDRTEKSYVRKIQEAVLAIRISDEYTKDQILEMYLNQVYYGHLSYGIKAAADTYFGKDPRDLNLPEAAMLAGLPQAPSDYDPLQSLAVAKARQAHVLDRMVDQGYITKDQAEAAKNEPLNLQTQKKLPFEAPHFVMYVRQLLEQRYGPDALYKQGLKVTTTLNLDFNKIAENSINAQLEILKTQDANNAGLVAIDPKTGEILAMVGSRDYNDNSIAGEVNMATSPRQPGSTIKPIEYTIAFSKGWGPETIIVDEPTSFPNTSPDLPPYTPHNFDYKFDGPMTIRYAIANSKNIPAIKTLMFDTLPEFVKVTNSLGIKFDRPDVYGLSLALGAGSVSLMNMVGAYSALDNYGVYRQPTAILKVEDWQGNVLEEYNPGEGRQVFSPVQAYMTTSILADNWARTPLQGPNSTLRLSRPDAAKTGSTDDYKDSWTIGYTPDLVAGVWVGNTDNRPMKEVLGAMGAGRIWHSFMEDVHKDMPPIDFTPPPGVKEYKLCADTGQPYDGACDPVLTEVWPDSYTPAQVASIPGIPEVRATAALGQTVTPDGQTYAPVAAKRVTAGPSSPSPEGQPGPTPRPDAPALQPPTPESPGPPPDQQQGAQPPADSPPAPADSPPAQP